MKNTHSMIISQVFGKKKPEFGYIYILITLFFMCMITPKNPTIYLKNDTHKRILELKIAWNEKNADAVIKKLLDLYKDPKSQG